MRRIRTILFLSILFHMVNSTVFAQASDPFHVTAVYNQLENGSYELRISFTIPEGHYLYADKLEIATQLPTELYLINPVKPEKKVDELTEIEQEVYSHDFTLVYEVRGKTQVPLPIMIAYQGCTATSCFMPVRKALNIELTDSTDENQHGAPSIENLKEKDTPDLLRYQETGWKDIINDFEIGGHAYGYMGSEDFLKYLEWAISDKDPGENISQTLDFSKMGILMTIILIFLGGLALNLTPCVLPMIPITVAIIGAGTQAESRAKGFVLGAMYGLGIMVIYGLLGLIIVLTGKNIGETLNGNPLFNILIAIVFCVLGLAMFDIISIDLTRFRKVDSRSLSKGTLITALFMGVIAALLAGACVAPVLIAVILYASTLYAQGHIVALLLPFLLGAGMAIPWPFAGAGMTFLPKPGKWMLRIKHGFGVIILVIALYYAYQGISLFTLKEQEQTHSPVEELAKAQNEGKPVLLYFTATWCKNCLLMEKNVFRNKRVQERLRGFVVIKLKVDHPDLSMAKEALDFYGHKGIPAFTVLLPPQ